jgi:hypothetical protein
MGTAVMDGSVIWFERSDKELEADQNELDDFDRRASSMPDIGVDLQNFDTEEHANAVGQEVLSALHVFGKILNLKRRFRRPMSLPFPIRRRRLWPRPSWPCRCIGA